MKKIIRHWVGSDFTRKTECQFRFFETKFHLTASLRTNPTSSGATIDMQLAQQFVIPINVPEWFGAKSR